MRAMGRLMRSKTMGFMSMYTCCFYVAFFCCCCCMLGQGLRLFCVCVVYAGVVAVGVVCIGAIRVPRLRHE